MVRFQSRIARPDPVCSRTRAASYADSVFNHNSGGDDRNESDRRPVPLDKVDPRSGKFPRDWKCFHPSQYETWDGATFGDMPDLCHRTPLVYTELINYARWLLEEVGFDGFRYDMVKGYGGWMVRSIQELRALREAPASNRTPSVNAGTVNSRSVIGWMKQMRGRQSGRCV